MSFEQRVGAYEITGLIGEGGMGAVYEARRADAQFERRVAIKMMRQGLGSGFLVERFLNERQVLARLEHPGIARMLDGGVTERGQPYFVMELVEGQALDHYVEDRKLAVRERIGLFRKLCEAVAFAHRNLVVHRDLKPQNVLVTAAGEPKLLDFGIAKLVDTPGGAGKETIAGFRVVTPRYASPEQFAGYEVSTRSDIYSLGVMLYELLAGRSPYGGATEEFTTAQWVEAVMRQAPPKPQAGADLDAIVMKAIAKDPEDRYATVEQLAQDLGLYLEGRAVTAREYRPAERVAKFVRRNKLAVGAAAMLLVAIAAGVLGTWWQGRIAQQERALAERRFVEARGLARLFLFDFYDAVLDLPGSTPVQRVLIDKTMEYFERMEQAAREDATLMVELAEGYRRMGDLLGNPYVPNVGDVPKAVAAYQRGIDLFRNHPAVTREEQRVRAGLRTSLAAALSQAGETPRGRKEMEESERVLEALAAKYPTDIPVAVERATLYNQWADYYNTSMTGGEFNAVKAQEYLERSCEAWRTAKWLDAAHPKAARGVAICQIKIGTLSYNAGNAPKAIEQLTAALADLDRLPEDVQQQQKTIRSKAHAANALGNAYLGQGENEKALAALSQSVALNERLAGADPKNAQTAIALAQVLRSRADTRWNLNDKPGAKQDYAAITRVVGKLVEANPENVPARIELAKGFRSLGQTEFALNQTAAAREASQKAFALLADLAKRPEATADALFEYAVTLAQCEPADMQRPAEAAEYLEKANRIYGGREPFTLRALALLYEQLGNKKRAIELWDQLLGLLPESAERERVKNKKKELGG